MLPDSFQLRNDAMILRAPDGGLGCDQGVQIENLHRQAKKVDRNGVRSDRTVVPHAVNRSQDVELAGVSGEIEIIKPFQGLWIFRQRAPLGSHSISWVQPLQGGNDSGDILGSHRRTDVEIFGSQRRAMHDRRNAADDDVINLMFA